MIMNGKQLNIRILLLVMLIALSDFSYAVTYRFVPGKGLEFSWDASDKVSITTGESNYGITQQVGFFTSQTAGATRNHRGATATGFGLKASTTYLAYFPYSNANDFDAKSIVCNYAVQTQATNGSTASFRFCDYAMSSTVTQQNSATFEFRHTGAFLRFRFAAPEAMTATALHITATASSIATTALMNLVAQSVTPSGRVQTATLSLGNIAVAKDGELELFMALPAQDLTAETLTLSLATSQGKDVEIAKVKGFNLKAGKFYDIDLVASQQGGAMHSKAFNTPSLTAVDIPMPMLYAPDILLDNDFTLQLVETRKKGDVNGDGDVDVLDAIALTGYYINGRTSTLDKSVCDVNGDGDIDILDVIAITSKYINGK